MDRRPKAVNDFASSSPPGGHVDPFDNGEDFWSDIPAGQDSGRLTPPFADGLLGADDPMDEGEDLAGATYHDDDAIHDDDAENIQLDIDELAAAMDEYHLEAEYRMGNLPRLPSESSLSSLDSATSEIYGDLVEEVLVDSQSSADQSLSQNSTMAFDSKGFSMEMLTAQVEHGVSDRFMERIFKLTSAYFAEYRPPKSLYMAQQHLGDEWSLVVEIRYTCELCGNSIDEGRDRCCPIHGCPKSGVQLHALNHGYVRMDLVRQLKDLIKGMLMFIA